VTLAKLLRSGILFLHLLFAGQSHALPAHTSPPVPPELLASPDPGYELPSHPLDRFWGDEFGLPIANGAVLCAVLYRGELVVGGNFTLIGGKRIASIARWNGIEWVSLGPGLDGPVAALLLDGDRLLVGGAFQTAGGVPSQGIAAWDGSRWFRVGPGSIVGEGEFRTVLSLTRYGGALIAGGEFESVSRPGIHGIARLDGMEWKPVGEGVGGVVRDMTVFRGFLYVTGYLFQGSSASIAQWNASEWTLLEGAPLGDGYALAVYGDRLFLGGNFSATVAPYVPNGLAAWNGVSWEASIPAGSLTVTQLHVHQDRLVIGGYWGLELWDGVSRESGPFFGGWPYAIVSDDEDIVVGGAFSTFDEQPVFHLGRWDGTRLHSYDTWRPNMHGLATEFGWSGYVSNLIPYQGQLLLQAEHFTRYYGKPAAWGELDPFMVWNGSAWSPFEPVPPYGGARSVAAASGRRLYQAGDFYDVGTGGARHSVIQFDGAEWSALDSLPGFVMSMVPIGEDLHIALQSDEPASGPVTQPLFTWDGTRWNPIGAAVGPGPAHQLVRALGEFRGDLVASGFLEEIGGVAAPGVAAWNGEAWRPLGSGPRGCFLDYDRPTMAAHQDRLILPTYPCGGITESDGVLESWDGQSWRTIRGIRGAFSAMASLRGVLYVSGSLYLDDLGWVKLAAWDGTSWYSLGSGLNAPAHVIVEHEGSLYFGGPFSIAGGKASFGVARWTRTLPPASTRPPSLSMRGANPFVTSADLTFRLDRPSPATVRILDVQGREVTTLMNEPRDTGVHVVRWDGRDEDGRKVPAGVYFISVETYAGQSSRKIVRLK
jgi:hypothetical protein